MLAPLFMLALLAPSISSQEGAAPLSALTERAPQESPAVERPLLELVSSGLGSWMPDPRDRGLVEALAFLGVRIGELQGELDGGLMLPPGALEVSGKLSSRPMALRVFELPAGGGDRLPLRAELIVLLEDPSSARTMVEQVIELLAMAGFEPAGEQPELGGEPSPGLARLDGPVPAWIGTRDDALVLALGAALGARFQRPDLQGAAYQLSLEVGRMLGLARDLGGEPQVDELIALIGPDARLETTVSFSAGEQVQRAVLADSALALTGEPLDRSLLDAMPEEAVWALAASVSPLQLVRSLRQAIAGVGEDPFAELEGELGLDLEQDLLAHLGPGWAAYASDATGGGGLMSAVMLWEVSDREGLSSALERIAEALGRIGAQRARGYVRVATRQLEGASLWTLTFPGFPIPVQPTLALGGRHLVLAMHPAGARAALGFTQDPGGLSRNERVSELLSSNAGSLAGIYYLDAPSLARDGYGYALGLGQMLENALRSPVDPTREIPSIVPSLAEMLRGAQAWTAAMHIEEGALRFEFRSDASAIARFAVQMGLMPAMYQMTVGPSFMLMPLLMVSSHEPVWIEAHLEHPVLQPWELDPSEQARSGILEIANAVYDFAVNNAGYPDSLDWLVLPDDRGMVYLEGGRQALVDPWGRAYGYERPSGYQSPRIYSLGRDGRPGGTGEDADIEYPAILDDDR